MLASKIFYVNSELRSTGTSDNFSFAINLPQQKFDRVCVLQASIPQSYYIIESIGILSTSEANNSFRAKKLRKFHRVPPYVCEQ